MFLSSHEIIMIVTPDFTQSQYTETDFRLDAFSLSSFEYRLRVSFSVCANPLTNDHMLHYTVS